MDSGALVNEQLEDGSRLSARLREERVPVVVAFWVREADDGRWSYCIATPLVDRDGPLSAYRDVFRVMRSFGPDFTLGASDVKLVGERHPVATDLLDLQKLHPNRLKPDSKPLVVTGINLDAPHPHSFWLSPEGTVLGGA